MRPGAASTQGAPASGRRLPIATIVILLLTLAATGWQMLDPRVLAALRRNPAALAAGEWWRLITPLFVHADGWAQIIVNLLGIVLVGPAVEWLYGSLRWLLLYFGPGLVAEAISYAWDPNGAGASIALCGLIGAMLAWILREPGAARSPVSLYVVYLVAGLVGYALGGLLVDVVLAVLAGGAAGLLMQRPGSEQHLAWLVCGVGLAGALVLTLLRDNHGPPILLGAGAAAALRGLDRRSRPR